MSTQRECNDCSGNGFTIDWSAGFIGSRKVGGAYYMGGACEYCEGRGYHVLPDVYDTAYPIDWCIAIGKETGMRVQGIVWNYDGPGMFGRPYAFTAAGRALLAAASDRLAYREPVGVSR